MPRQKELHFFDQDAAYMRGLKDYRREFRGWKGERLVGEATPRYFMHGMGLDVERRYRFSPNHSASSRIAESLPGVKTILSLRDPVTRAYSQFCRNRQRGREKEPCFRTAIQAELDGKRRPETDPCCWIYLNRYGLHLQQWLTCQRRDYVKVVIFDEWIQSPRQTLDEICEFLDISKEGLSDTSEQHNSGWEPRSKFIQSLTSSWLHKVPGIRRLSQFNRRLGYAPLDEETAIWLRNIFSEEVKTLESQLGRNIECWHGSKRRCAA